jgi:hypothetical protein
LESPPPGGQVGEAVHVLRRRGIVLRVHDDEKAELGELGTERGDLLQLRAVFHEGRHGVGVTQDVIYLLGGGIAAPGDVDGTDADTGKVTADPLRPVVGNNRYLVAPPCAERLESGSDFAHHFVELTEADRVVAPALLVLDSWFFPVNTGSFLEHLRNGRVHGHSSLVAFRPETLTLSTGPP